MVMDRNNESNTATVRLIDNARKNCPATPDNSPSGANTTTVVNVELVNGAISCCTASTMLSGPSEARRWMFYTTTTASSMTSPIATARPPIDI